MLHCHKLNQTNLHAEMHSGRPGASCRVAARTAQAFLCLATSNPSYMVPKPKGGESSSPSPSLVTFSFEEQQKAHCAFSAGNYSGPLPPPHQTNHSPLPPVRLCTQSYGEQPFLMCFIKCGYLYSAWLLIRLPGSLRAAASNERSFGCLLGAPVASIVLAPLLLSSAKGDMI